MKEESNTKRAYQATAGGKTRTLATVSENRHRLVILNWEPAECEEVRLVLEEGWSARPMRVFSFEIR